jgi:hypothetical protein
MTRLDMTTARCEALFLSPLQPSERPDADRARAAIMLTIRQYGSRGCAARVAQEFGDHPDTAPARMRWARSLVSAAFGDAGSDRPRARAFPCRAGALPVAIAA